MIPIASKLIIVAKLLRNTVVNIQKVTALIPAPGSRLSVVIANIIPASGSQQGQGGTTGIGALLSRGNHELVAEYLPLVVGGDQGAVLVLQDDTQRVGAVEVSPHFVEYCGGGQVLGVVGVPVGVAGRVQGVHGGRVAQDVGQLVDLGIGSGVLRRRLFSGSLLGRIPGTGCSISSLPRWAGYWT